MNRVNRKTKRIILGFFILLFAVAALPVNGAQAAFPGENGKIAFTRASLCCGDHQIYVMNADGTGQVNISNDPCCAYDAAWSSDGQRIAFTSGRDGNGEIYVMNANGTSQLRRTNNAAEDFSPAWSPDGRQIAFVSYRDGNAEIYVMNADGTGVAVNRTNSILRDEFPDWQPLRRPVLIVPGIGATYSADTVHDLTWLENRGVPPYPVAD